MELAFWTMGVPGVVALVLRLARMTLLPFKFKLAVLGAFAPKATAFSEPTVWLSAPLLPNCNVPPLIVTPPVNVLVAEIVQVLVFDFAKTIVPLPLLIVPVTLLRWLVPSSASV